MLDLLEINNTIEDLESQDTTFAQCSKLADLYIVREFYDKQTDDNVVKEYSDILPGYQNYCNIKKDFQLNKVTRDAVIQSAKAFYKEVYEFLLILYSNTEMLDERQELYDCLQKMIDRFNQQTT